MDTDRFIIQIETEYFYKDIANDVAKWFDTSNFSEDDKRPLPRGINKKVIGLFKYELGSNIMIEFVPLRSKTYSYLMDDGNSDKKAKEKKKFVIKREIKFKSYKDCLFKNEIILKSQQRLKVKHIMYILNKLIRFHW